MLTYIVTDPQQPLKFTHAFCGTQIVIDEYGNPAAIEPHFGIVAFDETDTVLVRSIQDMDAMLEARGVGTVEHYYSIDGAVIAVWVYQPDDLALLAQVRRRLGISVH